jgi:tetratricopeptide (TPR) repeat protein
VLVVLLRPHARDLMPAIDGPAGFFCFSLVILFPAALFAARALPALGRAAAIPAHRVGGLPLLCFLVGRRSVAARLHEEGVRLLKSGERPAALALLQKAIALDPSIDEYYLSLSTALAESDHPQAALEALDRLPARHAPSELFFAHRGMIHLLLGNNEQALADLARCGSRACDTDYVALHRGSLLHARKQWQAAWRDFKLAVELNPGNAPARLLLAGLQACSPFAEHRNGELALENARLAGLQFPAGDWQVASVLAAAYAERGEFPDALRYAREALANAPEEAKEERRSRIATYERGEPYRYE